MKKFYVKYGYKFTYEVAKSFTGSLSSINSLHDFEITIDEICGRYYCQCYISGIFVQIWCDDYKIEKIGG